MLHSDMTKTYSLLGSAVFRPGQEDAALDAQKPSAAVELTYKTVTKATGRKGIRYKDEATLLALMVVHRLLAGRPQMPAQLSDRTAVIVSSNFNNIDTVVNVARQIEAEHVDATSAMALPNASSNAVAATISILFQLRGVNLMLCNGPDSGLDAFDLGRQLLDSGRAAQVLIVGVEVHNEVVETVFEPGLKRFHGAAAVLLGASDVSSGLKITRQKPESAQTARRIDRGTITQRCGEASGAEGVLRMVLAHERARAGQPVSVLDGSHCWGVAAA